MLTDVPLILQENVYKYELKIKDGDKEIEEEVKIDTEQNTETYRIPQRRKRGRSQYCLRH